MAACVLGLDFGTESVRCVIVNVATGATLSSQTSPYAHGVIEKQLPASDTHIPPLFALQHPGDWLTSAAAAIRATWADAQSSLPSSSTVVGIGVAFTSCTVLPCLSDGTPLCLSSSRWYDAAHAWPKLWKHHAAGEQTARINALAAQRKEPWLARYGGSIGLEWLWPKMVEVHEKCPEAHAAAEVWVEAGDWMVWMLVSARTGWDGLTVGQRMGAEPAQLVRSTCQAGYKGCWSWGSEHGWPSEAFASALGLPEGVRAKLACAAFEAPGHPLPNGLSQAAKLAFSMSPAAPVSVGVAIIDAHAGVLGAGVCSADVLVMVLGTSSCHMIMSSVEREIQGVAGVVKDGILPGLYGYETGQAAVGDSFAWVARTTNRTHEELTQQAASLPPGSSGLLCLDWLNGCRTPLMDGSLSGVLLGVRLDTTPGHLYRAVMEGSACGVRWIVDTLQGQQVRVKRYVASGGLPRRSPLLMQIYADVLNAEVHVAEAEQPVALGAALLGWKAWAEQQGEHTSSSLEATMAKFTGPPAPMAVPSVRLVYKPNPEAVRQYDIVYAQYRELADNAGLAKIMRQLYA